MVETPIFDLCSFGRAGIADDTHVDRGERAREVPEVGDASLHPTSHTVKSHRTIGNLADVQRVSVASQGSGACALAVESAVEVKPKLVVLAYQAHVRPLIEPYGFLGRQALTEVAHAGNTEAHLTNSTITSDEQVSNTSYGVFFSTGDIFLWHHILTTNNPFMFLWGLPLVVVDGIGGSGKFCGLPYALPPPPPLETKLRAYCLSESFQHSMGLVGGVEKENFYRERLHMLSFTRSSIFGNEFPHVDARMPSVCR